MLIALGLDGLLANLDEALQTGRHKVGPSPFSSRSLLTDTHFWAILQVYDDVPAIFTDHPGDYIILTERPKRLAPVTESWLRRKVFGDLGFDVVYSSIKRYDCKLNKVDLHIDSKFDHEDWYQYDNIRTVKWERVEPNSGDRGRVALG